MKLEHSDNAITQSMTYGGAGTAFLSGISLNEVGVVIGIVVGVTGLVFQIWTGLERRAREKELHKKLMRDKPSK